jgi:hypothetical protein
MYKLNWFRIFNPNPRVFPRLPFPLFLSRSDYDVLQIILYYSYWNIPLLAYVNVKRKE